MVLVWCETLHETFLGEFLCVWGPAANLKPSCDDTEGMVRLGTWHVIVEFFLVGKCVPCWMVLSMWREGVKLNTTSGRTPVIRTCDAVAIDDLVASLCCDLTVGLCESEEDGDDVNVTVVVDRRWSFFFRSFFHRRLFEARPVQLMFTVSQVVHVTAGHTCFLIDTSGTSRDADGHSPSFQKKAIPHMNNMIHACPLSWFFFLCSG